MPIVPQGSINTTALLVPDAYILIVPPAAQNINGVPTNIGGFVGTASWGPANSPVVAGSVAQYQAIFGTIQPRKYDMGTALAAAVLQGANNFRCVRVTDGTDAAATVTAQTNCITFVSKYTGSGGNGTVVTISAGSQTGTFRAVVAMPGVSPETYDNIGLGLTGNALWVAIAAAVNSGNTAFRGPSQIVVAAAGAGTAAPSSASYNLTAGTDGATGVTGTTLVGTDGTGNSRTGMYALRGAGCAVIALVDCDTSSTWTTQAAFAISEATYAIGVTPAGDTISNAAATLASAGVDTAWFKLMIGDWCYWNDGFNNQQRLISPQGFVLGNLTNLAPNGSTLNKQLFGIIGTQKTIANQVYSSADLQLIGSSRLDIITNPVPGGAYFGCRFGKNTSSNPLINGDNYTRMTNYLATTGNASMGVFIGRLQAANAIGFTGTPSADAAAALRSFSANLQSSGLIGAVNGPPAYNVEIDGGNNTQANVSLGQLNGLWQVQYQSVITTFALSVQGGQSVTIPISTVPAQ